MASGYTPQQIARAATEHAEQAALFCWINRKKHYHPELEWIFAIPNGGSRDKITAGKLKAEGVTKGVFDLFVPYPKGLYHGLWIEMKKRTGGVVSPDQKKFGKEMCARGYHAVVCYSWEEAVDVISAYFEITPEYPATLPPEFIEQLKRERVAARAKASKARTSRTNIDGVTLNLE